MSAKEVAPQLPSIPDRVVDVKDFGALGDGKTDDAIAIQKAINQVAKQGGGTVRLSKGNYLSGPLTLVSHLRLQLEGGVVLTMLPLDRYPGGSSIPADFISAKGLTDLIIAGSGTIEGQGAPWWPLAKDKDKKRPRMISFHDCSRILIEGVTLQNSPMFHIAIRGEEVTVAKVTIRAPSSKDPHNPSHNTDACDVSGHNILVTDCDVSVGDDNYTCGHDTSNVLIKNCRYGTGHGVSIGSYTQGEVANITVRDCSFDGTECGIRIKSDRDRGGHVHHLVYENLTMKNVGIPILIYAAYNAKGKAFRDLNKLTPEIALTYPSQAIGSTTPVYEDITFRNITATVESDRRAGLIWGLPESPVGQVNFENVTISADLPFGFYFIKAASLKGVKIITPTGENKFAEAAAKLSLTP
jgi:polygalacturonase